jgi:SAM-dependent methyltransferase
MVNIPWWSKIIAKIILNRLPFGYRFWRKLGLFRHGKMDNSTYVIGVFNSHCERAGLKGELKDRVILELGPGDSIATAIVAASHGAKAILIDSGKYASQDVNLYKFFAENLQDIGLKPPDLTEAENIEDILQLCGSYYYTGGLSSLKAIEKNSIDLIFSQAVLEHIREHEFQETMVECKRILKNYGIASHRVDLKDHLGGGLNNLRFSNRVWESNIFVSSGFYTNRIRYSRMVGLIEEAGFEIEIGNVDRWDTIPLKRSKLATEFANLSDDDLLIKGFDVILR